ncbi:PRC-barrel domain containing protein [Mesorhizobium sp. M2A.F.Ca.ET.037.01.1.1]|uniref:PRC-barrel domain-containing protein n=1 Tax=unclassified Mesorhizobium TaxID=325217 RepID=UPI000F763F7D|nr:MULTISPECIES: PRC-barrel domain-containing protein [unclassified Mesorhizobium]RUY09722.1 PRC-barrel domain containing protein [Mesorhizobium sp. M2A.F.Ca.ET.040.01.1.1]RVC70584.1 PRC-barrel domain containing protein [Mesorhizobium sp. M00.F.Ca.ET.038.03.1.1]AZO36368.1 PRC-barrel domain containing protein [Mesorhizobium sp. M2A.F.Ca.ET.046.03.2.1]RUX19775.1 PRC-barrel domain containing protein [Mesorhizobium sp. M2A.F.Ca.ET.037.01.1.1]RWA89588.1 MAG: PRC-barrel domain containing protein [Me
MIRTLFATTAIATLLATGALAQTTTAPAQQAPAAETTAPVPRADGALMSNIIGESVYNGTGDDAQNIGKVDDVVFDSSGKAKSAIIGVGGFLGVGKKDVAFDYAKLEWAEKNGDRWLVAKSTKDELNALPAFDRKPYDPAPAQATDATQPANNTTAQAPAAAPAEPVKKAEGNLASNIMGESVYNGTADDAQKIGDVNDIVLAKDGKAESLVIGVGGFLGIGEKNVAYDFAKAKWAEKNGDRWLVAETTKEELQAQPDFNRKAYDPAPGTTTAANNAPAATTPAVVSSDTTSDKGAKPAEPAQSTAENKPAAPAAQSTAENKPTDNGTAATDQTKTSSIDKSTLTEMPMGNIRVDDLKGTTVYGANDAEIGSIGDVVLTPENKPDAVIVDVGGFLGIGAKEVALGMDKLKFMTDKNGKKYLYTNFTKEQLQAQTAYDKSSYAANRDQQRMMLK